MKKGKKLVLAILAVLGGAAIAARLNKQKTAPLANPFGEKTRYHSWSGGKLSYTVSGAGEPVLLIHGIYTGASSFEFRKNFHKLASRYKVYALDLAGCGLSERRSEHYNSKEITGQLEHFAREVIGEPAHVIASGLSAAHVMPSAALSPRLFRKLIFICPTGLQSLERSSGMPGDVLYRLLLIPFLGDALYNILTSHAAIRFYLNNVAYHSRESVTDKLIDHYYTESHQPGAKYLQAAFMAGKLNLNVVDTYPKIPHPTLILWGEEAKVTPVIQAEAFLQSNPRSDLRIFEKAALLPHDERPETFNQVVHGFLQKKKPSNGTECQDS